MARCGCTQACTCAIRDCAPSRTTPGSTVTGNGSQSSPYVICPGRTEIKGCDGDDVNHVRTDVSGNGIVGDEYVVCAQTTRVIPGPGIVMEGNGTEAFPYVVSVDETADCCPTVEAGTGITVTTTTDPDGQPVYTVSAAPSDDDCCPTVVAGDPSINVAPSTGPDGQPIYTLTVPPSAGSATFLDDGDVTTVSGDGLTAATAFKVDVTSGCGLEEVGGVLQANVEDTWPFTCDMTANAGDVYCDPATGQLKTDPPYLASAGGTASVINYPPGMTVNAAATHTDNLAFTNNDPCRRASGFARWRVAWDVQIAPGETVTITTNSASAGNQIYRMENTGTGFMRWRDQYDYVNSVVNANPGPIGVDVFTIDPSSDGPNSQILQTVSRPAYQLFATAN